MVLPMDGDMAVQEASIPAVVKESYSFYWWAFISLVALHSVMRGAAADFFGALGDVLLGAITWCMVRDNCARMTQLCVGCFGAMCCMQAFFEGVAVLSLVGGRRTEDTVVAVEANKKIYTTTVEKHSFFDSAVGWYYNYQSAILITSVLVKLIGAALAILTYKAFPTSLLEDSSDGINHFGGYGTTLGSSGSSSGTRGFGSPPAGLSGPTIAGGGGSQTLMGGSVPRPMFTGSGQRLGSV